MRWVVNYTPCRFTPGKETRYPLYRRLGGPQGAENLVTTGIRSPDLAQPVVNRSNICENGNVYIYIYIYILMNLGDTVHE
jgi:hypothetical protein